MAEKVLVTELYPFVEKCFSNTKNVKELESIIGRFIDKNSDQLSAIGPTKIILFTDRETDVIYKMVGVTPDIARKIKNKSKDIKSSGQVLSNPFYVLMAMIVRFFAIKKNETMVRNSVFYLGVSMYPSVFYKYYKYEPNENIMNYTINNLSNKFKIKQTGNLFKSLDETYYGAYDLHKDGLIKGNDSDIVQFILALKTRVNSFMKKIAVEFYKNQKDGKYLNTEFESNDDDNFHEADSSMYAINRIVDKVALKLVVDGVPIKLVKAAAQNNQVSVNELRNYTTTMITNEKINDIKSIIESILVLFLFDNKNRIEDINSNRFLLYCLDIYKRSNTTDENIVKIKKILDGWLTELGTYKKTQRLATINNFRRALYTFFVMSIQYANMH